MLKANLEVQERTNKEGIPYKMLSIKVPDKNGELITIHEIFLRESLAQIIKYFESEQNDANE